MKSKKQALAKSVLALLLCVAMLVGTTFAWFTDSVVSGINTIQGGNLDVELYHSNAAVSDKKVNANTELFLDLNGEDILWEPGVVSYENLTVANEGDLALVYRMAINTDNENFIVDGANRYGLSQVLKVGLVQGGITATDRKGVVESVSSWTPLGSFLQSGALLPAGTDTVGIVIYWYPSDNDNNWNLNNGKTLSEGNALNIDLGVNLTATQAEHESDFFGTDYDVIAGDEVFPAINGGTDGVIVKVDLDNRTTEEVVLTAGDVTITVPAGVLVNPGVDKLNAVVSNVNNSEANINLEANDAVRSLDVHVEGVSKDNDVSLTVNMPAALPTGLNIGNYELYHVEDGATNEMTRVTELSAHNQFTYNPANGDVVLYMQSFSEVAMVANASAAWEGGYDYSWYDPDASTYTIANADQLAAFGAIVGGMNKVTGITADGKYAYGEAITPDPFTDKTVNLINNVNVSELDSENGRTFYPVGYYNEEGTYEKSNKPVTSYLRNFEGIFDGQGHVVSNIYQNTWEMKGDHNWYAAEEQNYREGMGLFGRVYKGTVKNLNVENFTSDGEITTTGVIAAYADGATFENIAIFNCNPRVYNIGNGGIVGNVGWYAKEAGLETKFENITVDNTNKISALWGSWDVPCGGIVGEFDPTSGQSSYNYPENGIISFKNCHVAAQIDVNNDVCANYQYYAYRYAGMLIGTVSENETIDGRVYPKMDKIKAEGCTVHFGTWNDYYYCELVDNSLASYTHDHQMSRLVEVKAINGNTVTYLDGSTGTIPSSGRANYVIVDYTKGHGDNNAQCYHYLNGNVWNHADAGTETVNGQTVLKEDKQHLYLEFNNLVTGYGWGVTSKGVEDMNGVTILGRDEGNSVEKWAYKGATTLMTHKAIKIGDLFATVNNGVNINTKSVVVSVSDVNGSNPAPITGKFTANLSDWTQSTLVLEGYGTADITIQDYYFCKPTTIRVTVKNPLPSLVPDDLVVNGNVEENNLNGWAKHQGTTTSAAASYTGLYGINMKGDGSYGGMLNQTFTVEPGQTYTLFFWIRVNSNGVNIQIKQDNTDGASIVSGGWHTNTEWVKKMYTFTAPTDKVFLNFCGGGNGKKEDIYIDGIILEKKKIVTNGHIEYGYDGSWKLDSNSATIVHDDTHSGNYAVQIANPSAWSEAFIQRPIEVKPNTEYKVSFWTKRVSGDGVFNIIISQGTHPWTNFKRIGGQHTFFNYSTSKGWVKHSITVESGSFNNMMLKFTSEESGDGGVILLDDITVVELKESKFDGYLYNGDLEAGDTNYWDVYQNTEATAGAAHTGDFGLQLVGDGGWGGMANQNIENLVVGQKYKVTLWVKVVKYGANISFSPSTEDTENSTPKTWLHENDYPEWTQLTYVFTANASTVNMNLNGGGDKPEGGALIYIDDVEVTPF